MERACRLTVAVALAVGVVAVTAAGSGGAAAASPKQADPLAVIAGEALDVTAERLEVDVEQGSALLTGDVKATLGELIVTCDKVEIRYDESPQVRWARGSGGVKARLKGIEATASAVEVDVSARMVMLMGGVRLARGRGWVQAERASIDIATRKVSLHDVTGSIPVEPPRR